MRFKHDMCITEEKTVNSTIVQILHNKTIKTGLISFYGSVIYDPTISFKHMAVCFMSVRSQVQKLLGGILQLYWLCSIKINLKLPVICNVRPRVLCQT